MMLRAHATLAVAVALAPPGGRVVALGAVLGLWLLLTPGGCGRTEGMTCERAFELERYEDAVAACERAFERTGDVHDGIRAAKAHARSGRDDALLAWAERLRDAPPAATLWRTAARVLAKRGDDTGALQAHRRAADLYESDGKPGDAAYHAYLLAKAHFERSQLLEALEQSERAYALAYRSDDEEMRRSAFTSLFVMLYDIGDDRGARALLRAAQQTDVGQSPALRPFMRLYQGLLHFRAGRHALARTDFTQGLAAALEQGDLDTARLLRFNLVTCELALANPEAAQAQLDAVAREIPADAPGHARSAQRYHQALVHRARGQHEAAEQAARDALAAGPIPDWEWQLAAELGRNLEARGRIEEARAAYEQAIETIETMRRAMQLDDFKSTLLSERRAPYEALFMLHARAGRIEDALAVAEQARARTFLEAFIDASSDGEPASEPGGAQGPDHATGQPSPATAYPIARTRLSMVQFMAPVLTASPVVEQRPIGDVLATMGERRVLAYFQAGDTMWLYLHQGGARRLLALPTPASEIAKRVQAFLESPGDPAGAERLGAALLPAGALEAGRAARAGDDGALYVIADGVLGRVPFAAVRHGGGLVVERAALAYVPSLTALAALAAPAGTAAPAASTTAAPAAPGARVILGADRSAGAEPLPEARAEAQAVAAMLGVEAHLGERATIAALRSAAAAALLHVAGHGGIDASGAWLDLADGRAHAGSILAWRMRPRVAVLASCASAVRHGKDMWGALGAAFLAAGSDAVVATLWSVEDAPTRRLIERFYVHGGAETPARAVAAMQREAVAAGLPAAQWAPFVVFGAVE